VHVKHLFETYHRHLDKWAEQTEARIVDQKIDGVSVHARGRIHSMSRIWLSEVQEFNIDASAEGSLQFRRQLLQTSLIP
jgi:hypothetical protein